MSYFGLMLDTLMQLHGHRAVDLCQALHIHKSYFTKMKNGTLLPKEYALVESLAEAMRLTAEERAALDIAYKNTKYGPAFGAIELALKRMFSVKYSEPDTAVSSAAFLENGTLIRGKQHIMQVAARLLQEAEERVDLLFIPEQADICEMLASAAAGMQQGTKLNWLLYLCSKSGISEENVEVFVNALPLMLVKQADVRFEYVNFIEYDHYALFPFLLVSERAAIVMDRTMSEAIYVNRPELVEAYRNHFGERFHHARPFAVMHDVLEDFLEAANVWQGEAGDLYMIENRPRIVYESGYEELLLQGASAEDRLLLVHRCADLVTKIHKHTRKQCVIFSETGMREHLTEEWEITHHLSQGIPMDLRRKLFAHFATASKEGKFLSPHILECPFFEAGAIHMIHLWTNGKMLFQFHFGDRMCMLTMHEKSIATSLIAYLQMLMDCGVILSKQASIQCMEQMLERYGTIE